MTAGMHRHPVTPEISVVMPTYDGALYVEQQLRSILDQGFSAIEVIVGDDGSRDDTVRIVNRVASGDTRVRLLPGATNVGQRARLLELIAAAGAPLLAFSDQDDIWEPDKLQRLFNAVAGRSMAFGSSHLIDADGRALGVSIIDRIGPPPADGDRLAYLFRPHVSAHASLIRRDAISAMAFSRFAHFDWLLSLDAAFRDGIAFVPDAVVRHRIHDRNQTNTSFGGPRRWWSALRPTRFYGTLQRKRMRRFLFVSAVEHLAFSPVLTPAAQRDFGRIGALCRGAWFDPGISRPFANPKLARSLLALLTPHAGSERDLDVAQREIAGLTQM